MQKGRRIFFQIDNILNIIFTKTSPKIFLEAFTSQPESTLPWIVARQPPTIVPGYRAIDRSISTPRRAKHPGPFLPSRGEVVRRWLESVGRQEDLRGGKRPTGGVSRRNETERNTAAKRNLRRGQREKLSGSMMHGTSDSVVLLPCKLLLRSCFHLLLYPLFNWLSLFWRRSAAPRILQPD